MSIEPLSIASIVEVIVKKLVASALIKGGRKTLLALQNIGIDYGEHIQQTYSRCINVRTLLNRNESIDLLSLYVNLKFTEPSGAVIDDYDLIDAIAEKKSVIITGAGGSGKTVFIKYLWLALMQISEAGIPLYIELRKFSETSADDMASFIFQTVIGSSSIVQLEDFRKALKKGAFTILLDGFDEISPERKILAEIEIQKLVREYPNTSTVISSRHDDIFHSWHLFSIYRVRPLNKTQIVKLIRNLSYNPHTKRRFVRRLNSDLFERYESFLSSPLLATIMLITFDQFADVPEKVYLYYEQAFDALFAKHDAIKEVYKRKSYSGLTIDVFKKLLSYFCLLSYCDAQHEYTDERILYYLTGALKLSDIDLDPSHFLRDLSESVCILQRDGLNWTYTHRNFQEYFASYCLVNFLTDKMLKLFPKIISRRNDGVLPMCLEMNRGKVEDHFVIPMLEDIDRHFPDTQGDSFLKNFFEYFNCALCGYKCLLADDPSGRHDIPQVAIVSANNAANFATTVQRLYSLNGTSDDFLPEEEGIHLLEVSGERYDQYKPWILRCLKFESTSINDDWINENSFVLSRNIVKLADAEKTTISASARQDIDQVKDLLKKLKSQQRQRLDNIDNIFGL